MKINKEKTEASKSSNYNIIIYYKKKYFLKIINVLISLDYNIGAREIKNKTC
jgi:hypothetical protein